MQDSITAHSAAHKIWLLAHLQNALFEVLCHLTAKLALGFEPEFAAKKHELDTSVLSNVRLKGRQVYPTKKINGY